MAVVLDNTRVGENTYLMTLGDTPAQMGQFYMLRSEEDASDPLLGRPISVFDCYEGRSSFLYAVVGRGTEMLSKKRAGDSVFAMGPFGNGFSLQDRDLVAIGGGIGIAPLYMLIREWKSRYPRRKASVYLGFSGAPFMVEAFEGIADFVHVNVGGFITDDVPFEQQSVFMACGPTPMLKSASKLAAQAGSELYLSLEARMACGVGACLGCSCATINGNKRVCKDGPVFLSTEVVL